MKLKLKNGTVMCVGITHPQNSYTNTVHSAEEGGFYNLNVELND